LIQNERRTRKIDQEVGSARELPEALITHLICSVNIDFSGGTVGGTADAQIQHGSVLNYLPATREFEE
jgi:hypothetical protein